MAPLVAPLLPLALGIVRFTVVAWTYAFIAGLSVYAWVGSNWLPFSVFVVVLSFLLSFGFAFGYLSVEAHVE